MRLLSYEISQHGNEVELKIRLVAQDFYEVSVTLNNSFQLLCSLYIIRKITWIELHLKLKLCAHASFFFSNFKIIKVKKPFKFFFLFFFLSS